MRDLRWASTRGNELLLCEKGRNTRRLAALSPGGPGRTQTFLLRTVITMPISL